MHIHQFISSTGYCSRREAKRLLLAGRITVNGKPANNQSSVHQGDLVLLDGIPIPVKSASLYYVFNKPVGVITTMNQKIEGNLGIYIQTPSRVFPVGRLDKNSQGLLLLTNDGELANRVIHSDFEHEKEYEVTVDHPVTPLFIEKMSTGVEILRTKTRPAKVEQVGAYTFRITLTQGLNRQIRRMCASLGLQVETLKRIRIMNIQLGNLKLGGFRELHHEEINELKRQLNM